MFSIDSLKDFLHKIKIKAIKIVPLGFNNSLLQHFGNTDNNDINNVKPNNFTMKTPDFSVWF